MSVDLSRNQAIADIKGKDNHVYSLCKERSSSRLSLFQNGDGLPPRLVWTEGETVPNADEIVRMLKRLIASAWIPASFRKELGGFIEGIESREERHERSNTESGTDHSL